MSQEGKNKNNRGLGVFHFGIILLFVVFCIILISVFWRPDILIPFAELELWQDIGKMVNLPAKTVGFAFEVLMILLSIYIAVKITDYGKNR